MYKKYPEACWPHFTAAFVALLEMPEKWVARDLPEIYGPDVLGAIYMELCANPGSGQFFTPWSVASMMAQIVMDDIEETIFAHLRKAADKATAAEPVLRAFYYPATLMAVMGLGEVTPCAEAVMACYEPITICDPCCGSGIMQLAGAYAIPPWALHAGLVQFYGVDIDETCVRMAKINFLLYDLNGSYAKCALALSELELQSLPPDHCQVYSIAQVFQAQGLLEEVEEIKQDIRHGLFACLQFDFMTEEAQDAM
jgi:hypothetical protein